MKLSSKLLGAVLGAGLAMTVTALPASAAAPGSGHVRGAGYTGSADQSSNKAFFEAVMKSVAKKQAANPNRSAAVTVTYDASGAPTFASEIASSASIWNGSVSNVRLVQGSNADFSYYEGSDPMGSYASTDGHGRGYIFLDYDQNQRYNSTRVTAHETGHVLGLPDHYSGPCSELMSGGGPGTSCTNAHPDARERARVNTLWQNGLASALQKAAYK